MTATMPEIAVPAEFLSGQTLYRQATTLAPVDLDEGIMEGLLAPYGLEADIAPGLTESFDPGTFAAAVNAPGRIKVFDVGHSPAVIGHGIELRDQSEGIWGRLRISQTSAGKDALTLMRDGAIDELSVEFVPIPSQFDVQRRGEALFVRHRKARLLGVSPVPVGAYGQVAKVTSVRDDRAKERERLLAHLNSLTA